MCHALSYRQWGYCSEGSTYSPAFMVHQVQWIMSGTKEAIKCTNEMLYHGS